MIYKEFNKELIKNLFSVDEIGAGYIKIAVTYDCKRDRCHMKLGVFNVKGECLQLLNHDFPSSDEEVLIPFASFRPVDELTSGT